jgi:hypothetical protein
MEQPFDTVFYGVGVHPNRRPIVKNDPGATVTAAG